MPRSPVHQHHHTSCCVCPSQSINITEARRTQILSRGQSDIDKVAEQHPDTFEGRTAAVLHLAHIITRVRYQLDFTATADYHQRLYLNAEASNNDSKSSGLTLERESSSLSLSSG